MRSGVDHTVLTANTPHLHLPVIHVPINLITWITTHLPTPERWMAELAKTRSMQPYIILYKTRPTLQLGVRNLPKVFTRQRPGRESNRVSMIH